MAKNFNVDLESGLQEAITFTAAGKTYTCVELTDDVMERVSAIADNEDLRANEMLSQQLAEFTGEPAGEFNELTFRQKTAIIDHIMDSTLDPLGRKKRRNVARR